MPTDSDAVAAFVAYWRERLPPISKDTAETVARMLRYRPRPKDTHAD